jgi:hypothetical protein
MMHIRMDCLYSNSTNNRQVVLHPPILAYCIYSTYLGAISEYMLYCKPLIHLYVQVYSVFIPIMYLYNYGT